jgi:N-methylhydantoinase A
VGGTFTDFVLVDGDGKVDTAKVPSTPADQSVGVMEGLAVLAGNLGVDTAELLRRCSYLVHGTTVATNLMLELKGSTAGIVTTKGFRDIIDIRRNYREADFDIRHRAPDPLVRRRHRVGVTERIGAAGQVLTPLDEDELARSVEDLIARGVESIAVCFLFSFLNPDHEIRAREVIGEVAPGLHVSLSHEVLPRMREFERVSTTAVDAFVTPKLAAYLTQLGDALRTRGFAGEVYVMAANGGMLPIDKASGFGAQLVLSGPAGGVVAGSRASTQFGASGDAITVDMGGTSYDICLIERGTPVVNSDAWMNRHRVAVPTLDMKTIGAGGGSIAQVDVAGGLRVGPESAGADPGPACFGRGGELPTVTDANLVLGLLDENSFLGGTMQLDVAAAERAIAKHVAEPLGASTLEAAAGIAVVVNNAMANGIREVSIARGHDPRDFTLIAFGGAGPIHAGRQAKDLGVRRLLVPKEAPVLCALGDVLSDILLTKTRGVYTRASSMDTEMLVAALSAAMEEGIAEVSAVESVTSITAEAYLEMHYLGQTHEILVPAVVRELDDPAARVRRVTFDAEGLRETVARFHAEHERLYTFSKPQEEVEIVALRVDTRGVRPKPDLRDAAAGDGDASQARIATRAVYMEEHRDRVDTPIYAGDRMLPGHTVEGPAIIQERDTTVVAYPGDQIRVLPDGSYEIEVAA